MKSKARSSKRKKLQRSYLGAENRSFYIQWYVLTFTELRGAKGQVLQSCLKTFGQKCDLKLWERRHRKCGEKLAPKLQQEGLSSEKSWRRKSCWLLAGSIFYRREETKSCPLLCSALLSSALLCSDPCSIPLLLQQLEWRGKEGRGYSIINCWGVQPLRPLT